MVNIKQVVWEPIDYLNIFDLCHVSKSSCTLLEEKQNVHIFIQVAKQRKWKNNEETQGCRVVFRTLPNIYNGVFQHRRCLIRF